MSEQRLQCTRFEAAADTADYWERLAKEQNVFVSRDGNTITISAPIVWRPDKASGEHNG